MNIIEVKNNLVKLCYEEELAISDFILIKDLHKTYIAQILHLEASRVGKTAIAKIIFNFDGGIHAYDGSIPSLRAELENFDTSVLLNNFDHTNPLTLGKIAGKKDNITVNFDILKDNPIILAEKFFVTKILLNNFALQLQARKEKIIVFDTMGIFKTNKLTVTKDFKLPLNNSTINYIYEKGFEDATAESKSMIQAIFEELGEYSKTVEFIPFDTFKAVVDSEFMRTKLMQLVILKNKIKQIRDWNVFAQQENEFKVLKNKFENDNTVVLDISCLKESLQKECIKYVYSVLKGINSEFYAFTPVTNDGSDKFLLQQILNTENVHTTLICDYDYIHLNDLKKKSKNMLMFTPLKQQKDFGGYNIFLQKLAEDEFIAYGKMTKFVPIIGKLFQMTKEDAYLPQVKSVLQQPVTIPEDVPATKTPATVEEEEIAAVNEELSETHETVQKEELTEQQETENILEKPATDDIATEDSIIEESTEEITEITETEAKSEESEVEENGYKDSVEEHSVEIETIENQTIEEIQAPETETVMTPEVQISQMAGASAESVQIVNEGVTEEIPNEEPAEEPVQEENLQVESKEELPSDEVQAALEEVPDVDDEELSDDDLDMIEKLSKPDEEIQVINPKNEEAQPIQEVQEPVQEEIPEQTQEVSTPVEEPVNDIVASEPETPQGETLETRAKTTPSIPEYAAEFPDEDRVNSDAIQQGDRVFHQEFGEGVVEKMINYGDKVLCSVNFTNVGRRLLNPEISEMKKI